MAIDVCKQPDYTPYPDGYAVLTEGKGKSWKTVHTTRLFKVKTLSRTEQRGSRKSSYIREIQLPDRTTLLAYLQSIIKLTISNSGLVLKVFCPQAALALPFPIDEMSMIHRNTNQNEYFPIMRIPFGN